jgi:hypothetical protein
VGYRTECHFDGCATRFVAVSRGEYLEHVEEVHGEVEAEIYREVSGQEVEEMDVPPAAVVEYAVESLEQILPVPLDQVEIESIDVAFDPTAERSHSFTFDFEDEEGGGQDS